MAGRFRRSLEFRRPTLLFVRELCYSLREDHAHGLKFLGRHTGRKQTEKLLSAGAIEIDFSKYIASGLLKEACPIKRVFVNQLAANSPIEDRWNMGLTQVDGVVSSCLFTVLDGHSGTSCVHTLAWSILDYVAAAFLDTNKLHLAVEHWRTHDVEQPYHLARRLDLLSSTDHRRLGHAASPPSAQMSAHMRRCLRDYVEDLVGRIDRSLEPTRCMTDALLRLDDDLCSVGKVIDLKLDADELGNIHDPTVSRDLLRVALSGAVGVVGRIFWHNTEKSEAFPTELHLANVGDCGAVLLRQLNDFDTALTAIPCTKAHQGSCNPDELRRVALEHPENKPSELFREGGRLLGELAPCRAFGNVRYKWPVERSLELSRVLGQLSSSKLDGPHMTYSPSGSDVFPLPHPYTSPPYLTAKPDVTCFEITPADRYLVLATDGLWDMLSLEDTTTVMEAELRKPTAPATRLLWKCLTCVPPAMARAISSASSKPENTRRGSRSKLPSDFEETDKRAFDRAFKLLSLPPGLARYYRDDITVMVLELFNRTEDPVLE
ncbi:hypothetical protein P879_06748 [Paragonimus westermani]|uniref:PPM-type phosphatase domain-containing protein n=1 Tax=Paragonimus westermani TaxID=34504 RepID=A0A8T0D9Q7_9TREM|nr:hypothetical protein P879_06748 [Paragonimus westermani]